MRHSRRLLAALFGLLTVLAVAAPGHAAPAAAIPPAQYCDVRIIVAGQWVNGYVVNVSITNISNVPVTWRGTATLRPPGYIIQAWGASITVSGTNVQIWPPWNPPLLLPGQSVTLGYAGTGQPVLPNIVCQPA